MKAVVLIFLGVIMSIDASEPYMELVPDFDRINSVVTIRKITHPTMANLDLSAYDKNPVLFEPAKVKPKKAAGELKIDTVTFGGAVSVIKDDLSMTSLTEQEKAHPFAWRPMIKRMWSAVKDPSLQEIAGKINSFKWADPSIYQPYQDVTTAFLGKNNDKVTIWVKIEFAPWIPFVKKINDEDKDGIKEVYALLNTEKMNPDSLKRIAEWIDGEYSQKVLTNQETSDWITDLASYWYPTKNTDLMPVTPGQKWPDSNVNKRAVKQLKGKIVENPIAVVEGKPFRPDRPIYNVYLIENQAAETTVNESADQKSAKNKVERIDSDSSENFKLNSARFNEELRKYGSYEEWNRKNGEFFKTLKIWMNTIPIEQLGIKGKDNWLFFRKSLEYFFCGDLSAQATDENPLLHVKRFKQYLRDKNVNMLFVVVPNKEEIYFDKINSSITEPAIKMVNPYSRKILKDLQDCSVEVIDLLPHFLEAKKEDSAAGEPLYQYHDTHWTNRGLQIAAKLISDRIRSYSWYKELGNTGHYTAFDTTTERLGDIVERLPSSEQAAYKPTLLKVKQVRNDDGTLFNGNKAGSPVMLIGDSFTGVFESVDCKSAGIGASIAKETGLPLDIITSWGGGPLVRKKAMRVREKDLPSKKLVIYMMVARDLYNYAQKWEPFPVDSITNHK